MSHECIRLFTPYQMKNRHIKNRLVRSPMESSLGVPDGSVTNDHLRMYRTAAEGGVGLLITEGIAVYPGCKMTDAMMTAFDDSAVPGLEKLADVMHAHGDGVVVWAQLYCAGAASFGYSYGQNDNGLDLNSFPASMIEDVVESFGRAAKILQKAGFDGVEIHGGHGYLVSQFLSPAVNHRNDEWGGTPEKRMRFPLELYRSIREKCGPDFPVGIKMNTADFLPGGNWLADTAKIAAAFAKAGFDFIEASGGMGFMTELRENLRKHMGNHEYYFKEALPAFKEALAGTDTALCATGGIGDPLIMERMLAEGVDFIGLARPWLTEPDFANRVKAGDLRPTRCVSREHICNLCLTRLALGPVTCYKFFPGYCKMECPIDQETPEYIGLIAREQFDEAWTAVRMSNPLPASLCRICSRGCESVCRGKTGEPLAIRDLKRFVVDRGLKKGLHLTAEKRVGGRREKVAIVGSGPAGLACALELAKRGYRPVVFEKDSVKGGILRTAVPRYRLPAASLEADIAYIESAGVEIRTGTALGRELQFPQLMEEYKAVFLAVGAQAPLRISLPGGELAGVCTGLEFLQEVNGGVSALSGRVLVVGGGNVAVDAAMTAARLGAKEVALACLEKRADMPAYPWEVEEALEEGIRLYDGWGPAACEPSKDGERVSGVRLIRCRSVFDAEGIFAPQYDENDCLTLPADHVIIAVGQRPDFRFLPPELQANLVGEGRFIADPVTLATPVPGVFAGGDAASGPGSAVEAAKAGLDAAESIDRFLRGVRLERPPKEESYGPFFKGESACADPAKQILAKSESLRQEAAKLPAAERKADFREFTGIFTEEEAVKEARRCLKYDLTLEEESAARYANMGAAQIAFKHVTGEDW